MDEASIRRARKNNKENKAIPKVNQYLNANAPSTPPQGQKDSVCEFCGNHFEQIYYASKNRYSAFKLCPRCRKNPSNDQLQTVSTVEYKPFPWQVEAERLLEEHKYLVLACGARTGKDRFSNMMLIKRVGELINENRHIHELDLVPSFLVWVIAPTFDMAKQNFRELKSFLPKNWIVNKKESEMTFELLTGGVIEVKSAYDAESLVGVGVDFCTITEADRIKNLEDVWANVSRRLVSPKRGLARDRNGASYGCGKCIINSSPTGKGFFYEMWKWGQPDIADIYNPDFASLKLSCMENPFVREDMERVIHTKYGDITNYEYLKRTWPPDRFARDILGDFVDDTGTVFAEFKEKCVMDLYSGAWGMNSNDRDKYIKEWHQPAPGHPMRIGYDPATGSSGDDPAIVVRDMVTNRIVHIESLYGKTYDQQFDQIAYISKKYNYAPCCWLRTGHTAVENQLAKRGVQEIPLNEQGGKKAEYIQSLERAVQNGDLQVLDDGSKDTSRLIAQMCDYTESNGKYSNNLEANDDFVSSLYSVYYDYSVQSEIPMGFSSLMFSF